MLLKRFSWQKEKGISVIELLISVGLGVVLMGGLLSIAGRIYSYSLKVNQYNQLQSELQTAMDMMVKDLRRAGFWSNEQSKTLGGNSNNVNPFMVIGGSNTDISIQSINGGTNNCILFAYDYNKDGSVGNTTTVNSSDHFGYKISNNILYALTSDQNYNCTSTVYWENVTTPNVVRVTNLTFTLNNYAVAGNSKTLNIRYLTIALSGQLSSDATMQVSLTRNVMIREQKIT